MKTQVLILAAGRGQRFADAGFVEPKLLLKLRSKPIISYNLDTLLDRGYQPVVVGSPAVCRWMRVSGYEGQVKIVQADHMQPSPVHSALLASGFMDPDRSTWILDGDQIYAPIALERIVAFRRKGCAVVSIDSGINPSRCDVVMKNGSPSHLAEKQGSSNYTVAGGYYFQMWQDFYRAAIMVLADEGHPSNAGEARISWTVNRTGFPLNEVRIEEAEWISAGTPDELVAAESSL